MIKKISELNEATILDDDDIMPVVDNTNGETKKALLKNLFNIIIPRNAGGHNAIYRGKDITDYFYGNETYNGKTFSEAVIDGTFDNIFVGDYIIGKTSKRKYLVADINYRLHCGDTECTKNHVLMIPDRSMGTAQMNATNITTGAYVGSEMYKTHLVPFKAIIQNDFENTHILSHKELLTNAVVDGKSSNWAWFDSTIELMNESMVYGHNAFGSHHGYETGIDKSQLSLFKLDKSKIIALNDAGVRQVYWLRDVVSASDFAYVTDYGRAYSNHASYSFGVRPAFLIY